MSPALDPLAAEAMDVAWAGRIVAAARMHPLRRDAALHHAGGAVAIDVGRDSFLSRTLGLGLAGAVAEADLDALEAFVRARGSTCTIEASSRAHPTLLEHLGRRGYRPVAWTDLLGRPLDALPAAAADGARIEPVAPADLPAWAAVVERAFGEGTPAGPATVADTEIMGRVEGMRAFRAVVDGETVGGGLVAVDGALAWIGSAAVLPAHRGRGIQSALVRARLELARAAGASFAWVTARPDIPSHRNLRRLGFAIAATRLRFVGD